MKNEWMSIFIINISFQGFHKMCFYNSRKLPSLSISTSFQTSKCNIHVGRTTSLLILFISFHFKRSIIGLSYSIAFSFTNKSHNLCIISVSVMIMRTVDLVIFCCFLHANWYVQFYWGVNCNGEVILCIQLGRFISAFFVYIEKLILYNLYIKLGLRNKSNVYQKKPCKRKKKRVAFRYKKLHMYYF